MSWTWPSRRFGSGHDVDPRVRRQGDGDLVRDTRNAGANPGRQCANGGIAASLGWYRQFRALGATACIFEKGTLHTGSLAMDLAARAAFKVFVTIQQLEPPALGARSSKRYLGGLVPGLGLWWYRQRFRGWLRSLRPARTICITQAVRSALETGYGFSSRRLPVIHNGVDVDRFSPDSPDTDAARAPESTNGPLTFGTAARLIHEKGIDVAIRAFAQVGAPGA